MDVGLGDAADRGLQDLDLDLGMLQLGQLLADGLDRAADVGPEDDVERLHFLALAEPLEEVLQRDVVAAAARASPAARVRRGARRFRGPGRSRERRGSGRRRRAATFRPVRLTGVDGPASSCFFRRLSVSYIALTRPYDEPQTTTSPTRSVPFCDEHLGDHAASFVQLGFQAGAEGGPIGIGLVLVQFGHGQQRVEQFVDALRRSWRWS